MPIYEYKCQECGASLEVIQKVGESPHKKCPNCGGPLKKTISAPALQFKGEGWYVTDYARKESSKEDKPGEIEQKRPADDSKKEKKEQKPSKD